MTQRKSVCHAHDVISAGGFPQFCQKRILLLALLYIPLGVVKIFFAEEEKYF